MAPGFTGRDVMGIGSYASAHGSKGWFDIGPDRVVRAFGAGAVVCSLFDPP